MLYLKKKKCFALSVYGVSLTTVFSLSYENRLANLQFSMCNSLACCCASSPPPLSLGDKGLTDCLVHTEFHLFFGFPVFCFGDAHTCGGGDDNIQDWSLGNPSSVSTKFMSSGESQCCI